MGDANPSTPGLTERDVIIIASICAVIIVSLLIVLVCFICRRRRNTGKDYESEATVQRPPAVNGSAPAQKQTQTFDNAGMTRVDEVDLDVPDGGAIFTTSHHHSNNNSSGYGPLDLNQPVYTPRGRHIQPNGHVPHDTSYDSQLEKRMYENEMNRRNESVSKGDGYRPERQGDLHFHGTPRSPSKDKYLDLDEKKEPNINNSHEMMSEPNKPKKVIYEVVV